MEKMAFVSLVSLCVSLTVPGYQALADLPEARVSLEFAQTPMCQVLDAAFKATGQPYLLPRDLPNRRLPYVSVKNRPIQRAVEMIFRAADLDCKGLVVTNRDGTLQIEFHPVTRVDIESTFPDEGKQLAYKGGPARVSITNTRRLGADRFEVRLDSSPSAGVTVWSAHQYVSRLMAGDKILHESISRWEGAVIMPTFRTKRGILIELKETTREVVEDRMSITGVLTFDPADPPTSATWELYHWQK